MAITDLIPWKKDKTNLAIRSEGETEALFDIRQQMNRMFDEFFERPIGLSPFFSESSLMGEFTPQLDISETDKAVTISAELPGLEPEDIHLALDHNILTIRGEKHAEKEDKGKRYYKIERSYGSFQRSIPLPVEVDEDKIDATFKRGVLKIKLPKTETNQERGQRITIKPS